MFPEDELLPISALQHLVFCERQWALIHLEGVWEENPLTVEGHHLHERTHAPETEVRGNMRIVRGLRLRCFRLGLTGISDVVEFHRLSEYSNDNHQEPAGASLDQIPGSWQPFPVEYKRGKPKTDHSDEVQICAQALCLEEMLRVSIPSGALFYGKSRRRTDVFFNESLRNKTETFTQTLHERFQARITPQARYEKKCDNCSLYPVCLPKTTGARKSARTYLSGAWNDLERGENQQ